MGVIDVVCNLLMNFTTNRFKMMKSSVVELQAECAVSWFNSYTVCKIVLQPHWRRK